MNQNSVKKLRKKRKNAFGGCMQILKKPFVDRGVVRWHSALTVTIVLCCLLFSGLLAPFISDGARATGIIVPGVSRVVGDRIFDEYGNEVMWRGAGGSYLMNSELDYLDGYKLYMPTIKYFGLNTWRLAFRFPWDPGDNGGDVDFLNITKMDEVVDFLAASGVRSILEYDGSWLSPQITNPLLLQSWKDLATHYRGNPNIAAYEIYNEPSTDTGISSLQNAQAYYNLTVAIRSVDPDHICIWETPPYHIPTFDKIETLLLPNVVYTLHRWWTNKPEEIAAWGSVELSRIVAEELLNWRSAYNIPVWLGEFGGPGGGNPQSSYNASDPYWRICEELLYRCEEQVISWNLWMGVQSVTHNRLDQYKPLFPLKIFNTNLVRQPWISPIVPRIWPYVLASFCVDNRDDLVDYVIRLRHNGDYAVFKPGIIIRIVTTHFLANGTVGEIFTQDKEINQSTTTRNEEGTTAHPGNWDTKILSMRASKPSILADGFEAGSPSTWTGTSVTSGETATAVSSMAHHGFYSADFTSNGGGGTEKAYCFKTVSSATELYARGYFYVSASGIAANDNRFYFLIFKAGGNPVAFAGWRMTGGVAKWNLLIRSGTGWVTAYSAASPALNKWYCVELHWKKDATSGLGELWVDGAKVCSLTGKNTAYYGDVDRVDFGLPEIVNCGSTTVYCDCVKLSNAYIGSEPVFTDGFESGSFSAWTAPGTSVTSDEIASVVNSMAHHGTYSAKFTSNGNLSTERAYCYTTIAPQAELYARGYFRVVTSGVSANDNRFYFLIFKAGGNPVAFAGWRMTGGIVKWNLIIRDGTGWVTVYSTTSPALNQWYCVELHWKKDAAAGLGELYVDGALACSIIGKNTTAYGNADRLEFGLPEIVNCASTTAYCDCVKVATVYLGPEP
jgi:hypothetical protein